MRKGIVLVAALLVASFSSAALAAKKKAGPDPAIQAQKESAAFFYALFHPVSAGDGLPGKQARAKGKKS